MIEDCRAKYGEHVERMVFPLRGFEFVRSTYYPMADGGHVCDLRIGVLFEPGRAQVFPVSLRIAPIRSTNKPSTARAISGCRMSAAVR